MRAGLPWLRSSQNDTTPRGVATTRGSEAIAFAPESAFGADQLAPPSRDSTRCTTLAPSAGRVHTATSVPSAATARSEIAASGASRRRGSLQSEPPLLDAR